MRRLGTSAFLTISALLALTAGLLPRIALAGTGLPGADAPDAVPAKADPAAYALLRDASEHRSVWTRGVTGLTAAISVDWNGVPYSGTIAFTAGKGASVTIDGAGKTGPAADARDWARDQLDNLLGHRIGGTFAQGDGRYPITFAPDDASPLGRKVLLHDGFASSYRVKDHQIQEVDRTMGDLRLVITMQDFTSLEGGRYLPKSFAVTYFDPKTNALKGVEYYSDSYARIDGNDVPVSRRIVTPEAGKFTVDSLALSDIKLTQSGDK